MRNKIGKCFVCLALMLLILGTTIDGQIIHIPSTKHDGIDDYKTLSLKADSASMSYYIFGHIGPLWLPHKPLQFNVDKDDNVELIIDNVKQDPDLPALIYLRGFFGLGPSLLKRHLMMDSSINLKGICKEPIIVPIDVFHDYIDEQPVFNITDIIDFGQTAYGLATADFNKDGYVDFAVSAATAPWTRSTISIFYNDRNGSFTKTDVYTILESLRYIQDLDAADYDNDGDIDLLYTHSEAVNYLKINGTGKILLNNGANSFRSERIVFWHGPGDPDNREENRINPQVASADYDGDGDVDFAVGDNSGKIELYLNDGTGNFTSAGVLYDYYRVSWGLSSGDYDNDGDIDLLVSAEYADFEGCVYFHQNQLMETNNTTCFTHDMGEPLLYVRDIVGVAALQLFDFDQDDDLDILVGIGDRVYLCLVENKAIDIHYIGQLPENYEGYLDDLNLGGITAGDYNDDGKQDIILGGVQGVIRYCENNYGQLSPFIPFLQQPSEFYPNRELYFGFMATDVNNDSLSYYIDWGDGTDSGWIGPYPSGEWIELSHIWNETKAYWVKAKAKDEHGAESRWKEYVLILQEEPRSAVQLSSDSQFESDTTFSVVTQLDYSRLTTTDWVSIIDSVETQDHLLPVALQDR
jgi:hypothetical protein